jgi:hypothetical protein
VWSMNSGPSLSLAQAKGDHRSSLRYPRFDLTLSESTVFFTRPISLVVYLVDQNAHSQRVDLHKTHSLA